MRLLLCFALLPFLFPSSALAEVDPWEEVVDALRLGDEIVILPLPSELSTEFREQPPPSKPQLHFSGAQVENISVAQVMLAVPLISVGNAGAASPFFAIKGQSDGTREGNALAIEAGMSLSIREWLQVQFSIERII